jgi:hypothetical protein
LLSACGGTLTDEQRKKVKEDMKEHAIRKIGEAEIIENAYSIGRMIAVEFERKPNDNKAALDSLQEIYSFKVAILNPGEESLRATEKQIIDAYTSGSGKTDLIDNVQRLGSDSLLYTKPIMRELTDGSLQFNYAIGVWLSKKQVIQSIKD